MDQFCPDMIFPHGFSLVVFGGDGVLDLPRSIVVGNNVFSEVQQFLHYFENIPTGNGNSDIFGALRFATNLLFRPAVAKTFILLPCTTCDPSNMTLDYTVLHQVLLENDIKLHILMNEVFRVDKDRVNKMFYGIDSINAYTKKDFKNLKGSTELRRQVRLPKAHLGFCIPLAMESNGTIFSAKKLELTRKNAVKKFVTVFTRRVALTAIPCQCQKCECTADNDGMSYMECFPCQYPTPGFYNVNGSTV
uniref:Uncharacterized protein n=1 Tax=Timema douglasi TaxID=61478 RepID=A0A7R8VMB5_TIMDO|nr:unnamed protein product [Timema douglasi]